MYAARPGGGVDLIVYGTTNPWPTYANRISSSGVYSSLAGACNYTDRLYAAKPTGGIDLLINPGSNQQWITYDNKVNSGTVYNSIVSDGLTSHRLHAARVGGGIDVIVGASNGTTLVYTTYAGRADNSSDNYITLAASPTIANRFYGLQDDGTIDLFVFGSPSYVKYDDVANVAVNGDYVAIAASNNNGNVDLLVGPGTSWVVYADKVVSDGSVYGAIATSANVTDRIYAATIPEPATVVLLSIGGLVLARRRR